MVLSYRITSLAIGIGVAAAIFFLIRKDRLHTRYSLWWFLVATASAMAGAFPEAMNWVARGLGVHYSPTLVIVIGLGMVLVKMLTMDIDRSVQEQRLRILAERLAVMEARDPAEKVEMMNDEL